MTSKLLRKVKLGCPRSFVDRRFAGLGEELTGGLNAGVADNEQYLALMHQANADFKLSELAERGEIDYDTYAKILGRPTLFNEFAGSVASGSNPLELAFHANMLGSLSGGLGRDGVQVASAPGAALPAPGTNSGPTLKPALTGTFPHYKDLKAANASGLRGARTPGGMGGPKGNILLLALPFLMSGDNPFIPAPAGEGYEYQYYPKSNKIELWETEGLIHSQIKTYDIDGASILDGDTGQFAGAINQDGDFVFTGEGNEVEVREYRMYLAGGGQLGFDDWKGSFKPVASSSISGANRRLSDDELYSLFDRIPANIPSNLVGDRLNGSQDTALKDIYLLKGDFNGLALAVAKSDPHHQQAYDNGVLKEIELLDELEYLGIPVVRFSADAVKYNGRPAFAMELMVGSNRDLVKSENGGLVAKDGSDTLFDIIRSNRDESIRSLEGIKQAVKSADVEIVDIQFLFDNQGRFVVNDPEKIIPASKGGKVGETIDRIDLLADFIKGNK